MSDNSFNIVYWDPNCEAKDKDDDKVFKLSWDLINLMKITKELIMYCAKFEYITEEMQTKNFSFPASHDVHSFLDKLRSANTNSSCSFDKLN